MEAFSDAVDREIRAFDTWCAGREEEICRASIGVGDPLIVSLLSLEKALRDTFADTFGVILEVLRAVMDRASHSQPQSTSASAEVWILPSLRTRISPAALTALLLDTLLHAVQERLSMVDMVTSDALMRVFATTAEPVWMMVGRWLEHGMPIRDPSTTYGDTGGGMLDDEFFIEDNEVLLMDPDYWAEGYVLRMSATGDGQGDEVGDGPKTVPVFLAHVAADVLASGKATGLLRALGIPPAQDCLLSNRSFGDLLALHAPRPNGQETSMSMSTDTLSRVVYDELFPHCQAMGVLLTTVLVDDCELWRHMSAIEDLYLMRRGDSMSHFTDVLFAKVRSSLSIFNCPTL